MGIAESQSSNGTAIVEHPVIHGVEEVRAGRFVVHGAKGVEIGFIRSLGQLSAAMEVS